MSSDEHLFKFWGLRPFYPGSSASSDSHHPTAAWSLTAQLLVGAASVIIAEYKKQQDGRLALPSILISTAANVTQSFHASLLLQFF